MQIFMLDTVSDPDAIAQSYCDSHMKICLEITQMVFFAWVSIGDTIPPSLYDVLPVRDDGTKKYIEFKRTPSHANHPMTKWIKETGGNYLAACRIGLAIAKEYTHRYGKQHACQVLLEHALMHVPACLIDSTEFRTFPPQCFDESFQEEDPADYVVAHRKNYENKAKTLKRFSYTKRDPPTWLSSCVSFEPLKKSTVDTNEDPTLSWICVKKE